MRRLSFWGYLVVILLPRILSSRTGAKGPRLAGMVNRGLDSVPGLRVACGARWQGEGPVILPCVPVPSSLSSCSFFLFSGHIALISSHPSNQLLLSVPGTHRLHCVWPPAIPGFLLLQVAVGTYLLVFPWSFHTRASCLSKDVNIFLRKWCALYMFFLSLALRCPLLQLVVISFILTLLERGP